MTTSSITSGEAVARRAALRRLRERTETPIQPRRRCWRDGGPRIASTSKCRQGRFRGSARVRAISRQTVIRGIRMQRETEGSRQRPARRWSRHARPSTAELWTNGLARARRRGDRRGQGTGAARRAGRARAGRKRRLELRLGLPRGRQYAASHDVGEAWRPWPSAPRARRSTRPLPSTRRWQ